MPVSPARPTWSTPVAEVEQRLRNLDAVLQQSVRADGGVDLVKAKALAGTDRALSKLVTEIRYDAALTGLTPAQAREAFLELRTAVAVARHRDANGDGAIGSNELGDWLTDDKSQALIDTAALPVEVREGNRPAPKVMLSLKARREAEALIHERATFHAATPLGAAAMEWEMRDRLTQGLDVNDPMMFDAINFAETSWQSHIPFFGRKWAEGRGHLSDAELEKRYGGDLQAYCDRVRERINTRLLMDYETEFLAGRDLA